MNTLEIYDPAMCCSSGVCGTDVDPALVRFAADLAWIQEQGINIQRFNLAQQPAAFAGNPLVRAALEKRGNDCLPLVLVNGAIVASSIYPTREQLAALAGIAQRDVQCCSGESSGERCCGGQGEKTGEGSCCCS